MCYVFYANIKECKKQSKSKYVNYKCKNKDNSQIKICQIYNKTDKYVQYILQFAV
jgi:hypothetical protein